MHGLILPFIWQSEGRYEIIFHLNYGSTKHSKCSQGWSKLRATIPQGIVSYLDVKSGDKLNWTMIEQYGKRLEMVTKKKGANTREFEMYLVSNTFPYSNNNIQIQCDPI